MTKRQKLKNIMLAILDVVFGIIMTAFPYFGYQMVMMILSVTLMIYGLKQILFYFTMARHMVGGKRILYNGMIIFDLGAFTVALADIPRFYIMIYLMGGIIFTGAIEILRAMEKKKLGAGYKFKLVQGIVCILIGILGVIFSKNTDYIVYFYCLGMLYSAYIRIAEVFRKDNIRMVAVAP